MAVPRRALFVRWRPDRIVPAVLAAQAVSVLLLVAPMLTRPLWYNEQWRGWFLSQDTAPIRADPLTPAPISLGFATLSRLSMLVLGRREIALRAPSAIALVVLGVVAYRLARRWLGPAAASLTVGALLLNRMLVTFGAELAPYTVEAACVTAMLVCWFGAHDPGTTRGGHAVRYAAMAALAVVATPAILVLGPLLAVDVVRAVRTRTYERLVPVCLTGVTALLHLALYVATQSAQRHGPYWEGYFVPRAPGAAVAAVWRGLAGYVPNALTGGTAHLPSVPDGEIVFPGPARAALIVFMAVAIVAGLVAGLRDDRVRPLPVALLGCLALQVVASLGRAWPFGLTRVNTFLLPLGYIVAAVGLTRAVAALSRHRAAYAGAAVAAVVAYALVLSVGVRQVASVRREATGPAFGTGLASFVDLVRERADPRDVVVLVHQMTEKGWKYYMHVREGGDGVRLRPERSIVVSQDTPDTARLAAFLAAHPDATRVYVVAVRGTPPAVMREVLAAVKARRYVRATTWREPHTGGLIELVARG